MRILSILVTLNLAAMLLSSAHASDADDRPMVGLALSGGGTKAGAHIGVLRVLEENRVPIDYIAGTSAGAIIGSLYAIGLSPDEIEAVVADIDWDDMLRDSPPRRDLPFRRKRDSYNYLVKYRPGYNDGELSLPTGLIQGQKVTQFFRRHFSEVSDTRDFDALPIPLRVVATDLVDGQAVVIGSGDLALAVRASMSIPVLFAPVDIGGRRLIDGGPANNLPIDVVRKMGADIVIAVDITAPLLTDSELDSVLSVADQMANILTQANVRERVATLSRDDILIQPVLEGVGGLEFATTLDTMKPGEQAARAAQPMLSALSLQEEAYRRHVASRAPASRARPLVVRSVQVNNRSEISTEIIERRLGLTVGDSLDSEAIEDGVANVFGLDLFERVDYRLQHGESGVDVIIDAEPKPWGPSYLQFGLELSEDFSQGSDFNLGIAYLKTAMNSLGGEWRAQLDLGERQGLTLDWYQPLSTRSGYFVELETLVARRNFRFFEQDAAVADVRVSGWGGALSAGSEIGRSSEFRVGWNRFTGDADVVVGGLDVLDDSVELGEFFSTLRYDRIDNANFPRRGVAAAIGGFWSREAAGASADFEQFAGSFSVGATWGANSMLFSIEGGTTVDDDAPLESQYLLGGLGRLSGHPANRFAGQHYGLASLTSFRRVNRNLWIPMYAGLSLEAGNVWDSSDQISSGDLQFAGAVFAGADTPLGPLYLAWGLAEGGENTVYLYLGNPFLSEGSRPLD